MFVYRPPKGMCWGNALKPKDPVIAKQKLDAFLETNFELVKQRNAMFSMLRWKRSALPSVDLPEEYLKPEYHEFWFGFTGDRVMFPSGLWIPILPQEMSSYEFLSRFSESAPFTLSPRHFSVLIPSGKHGRLVSRKPDGNIARRLHDAISN
jgi:hypothetical protein